MNFKEELKKEVLRKLEKTITGVPISLSEEVTQITEIILTNLDGFEEKELLRYLAHIFVEINLEIFSKHLEKKIV
ncbi:MAG: hypothetical protein ACLUCH_03780 [Lachnospirales bacterium]